MASSLPMPGLSLTMSTPTTGSPSSTTLTTRATVHPLPAQVPLHVRNADYTLNRDKLLNNLIRDSDKPDTVVEVNNHDSNVNIQCNSGYFHAVVRPSFSSLDDERITRVINGLSVSLPTPPKTLKDSTSLNQTLLYQFIVTTLGNLPIKVSVHLHLTSRLIQVQGGARLANTTAAIWFHNHFVTNLLNQFAQHAGISRRIVNTINHKIQSAQTARKPSK